ncbi:MAG: flagellar filament capping protein FliD [Pseudomonadota bacterium]
MAITSPTYDPISTASALAEKYVSGQQQILTSRSNKATATDKGLGDLGTALSSFQASLTSLTGSNKTLFTQSAVFSDTAIGSATATAVATPGTYSLFVERLATASQVSYSGLTDESGVSGELKVKVGTTTLAVNMVSANANGGALTPREIAAAINAHEDNASLVTASVIATGTDTDGTPIYELVLTAKNTGAGSAVSLDAGNVVGSSLPGKAMNVLVKAEDALIKIGSASGTPITQATNTFDGIEGVKMTFTKTTSEPVTLTVSANSSATAANVQGFVDAYNKLKTVLDALVAPGDPSKGKAGGTFAGDSGITALRDRLVSLLRQTGSTSLAAFGITANRQGSLTLDTTRLNKALALDPNGLDKLIGTATGTEPSGIAAKLDAYIKGWTSATNGQIKARREAVSKLQLELTSRQDLLDKQYDTAYNRYLMQFTQLQTVQSLMTNNSSMFDALFSSDKD